MESVKRNTQNSQRRAGARRSNRELLVLYGNYEARKALLLKQYDDRINSAKDFAEKLHAFLLTAIDNTPTLKKRVQFVSARAKSRASFIRKISRSRETPYTSIEEITDLVGVRIVTLFEPDIDAVGQLICKEFDIDEENSVDKRRVHGPAKFGYLSRHLVFGLNGSRKRDVDWSRFSHLKAEIQIRTVSQHAWAEVEHELGYHSKAPIPEVLKRRFARLAALLEIVDEEFVLLEKEVSEYREKVENPSNEATVDIESLAGLVDHDRRIKDSDKKIGKNGLGIRSETSRDFVEFLVAMTDWIGIRRIGDLRELMRLLAPILPRYAGNWLRQKRELDRGIAIMYAMYFVVSSTSNARERRDFQITFGLGKHVSNFERLLRLSVQPFPAQRDLIEDWRKKLRSY